MAMYQYKIVSASTKEEAEVSIQAALDDNFNFSSGLIVTVVDGAAVYYQPMVKGLA